MVASSISKPFLIERHGNLAFIFKPPDFLTHASLDKSRPDLQSWVRQHLSAPEAFVAHRLDAPTSGILLFGLTPESAFQVRDFLENSRKFYLLQGRGIPEESRQEWVDHLKEDRKGVRIVRSGGKKAVTIFQKISQNDNLFSALVEIKTGRRHQIRIQAASHNLPLIGENLYSDQKGLLHLHAWLFLGPKNQKIPAPVPDWLGGEDLTKAQQALDTWDQ